FRTALERLLDARRTVCLRGRRDRSRCMTPKFAAVAAVVGSLAVAGCSDGPSGSAEAQTAPPELFVVGDSLSDTGNAAGFVDYLLGQPMYPEATIGLCNPGERWLLDRDCTDIL